MTRVIGYCDHWSVAPGDTVRFMASCLDGDSYEAQIVRLKQPDAGPLATRFAPEPVGAPCNGRHAGRRQAIRVGSLAVVAAHPALAPAGSFTLASYLMPTTPTKGRQAIMGTWCEATQTGFGLEIDAGGALSFRIGAGPDRVASVSTEASLSVRRWHFVAASFDAAAGALTIWQEPLAGNGFHAEASVVASAATTLRPAAGQALRFAAWSSGPVAGPAGSGGLGFACHFNGRIDSGHQEPTWRRPL